MADSFNLKQAKVPADTRAITLSSNQVENFSLKLNRFAREEDGKFLFLKTDKSNVIFEIDANFSKVPFDALCKRQSDIKLSVYGENALELNFAPDWRLIIGLGGASVYETDITLHHVYGFPYIPSSGIKGVLRNWMICKYFQESEKRALKDKAFCDIFGCPVESVYKQARKGKIDFLDAYPLQAPKLKSDIMNPHYGPWYGEGKAPADYYNPVPVFFLTVEQTPFQFIAGTRQNFEMESQIEILNGKQPLDIVKELLPLALTDQGIGAKTAVGYGKMKPFK